MEPAAPKPGLLFITAAAIRATVPVQQGQQRCGLRVTAPAAQPQQVSPWKRRFGRVKEAMIFAYFALAILSLVVVVFIASSFLPFLSCIMSGGKGPC